MRSLIIVVALVVGIGIAEAASGQCVSGRRCGSVSVIVGSGQQIVTQSQEIVIPASSIVVNSGVLIDPVGIVDLRGNQRTRIVVQQGPRGLLPRLFGRGNRTRVVVVN